MQNLVSENILTMSSREIAELTEKKHFHVLRDIEVMLVDLGEDPEGYIHFWAHPQNGQQYREFLLDRDHTVCLLTGYSATHRMRVIKRWQELEESATSIPQMSQAELIAAMAQLNVQQERRLSHVEEKLTHIEQGTIPQGYQGYSYLQAQYGLSNAKCKQLVMAFSVPHKKVPHVAPGGQVTQMSVVDEYNFGAALHQMMREAEKRGSQWYHPKLGRFTINNWEAA